ncbi:MAG: DM13 domain-containing protein [Chloroflexaceae bacterium]|nr:DM13 domain-containing protein [Chloroflexaceae bacterium]
MKIKARTVAIATSLLLSVGTISCAQSNQSPSQTTEPPATEAPQAAAEPEQPAVAKVPIATGTFVTVEQEHPTAGTATIVEENGKRYLEFDETFTTAEGPDVNVILYRGDTLPVNLAEADYQTLAKLEQFNGAQRYEIPDAINLGDFQAVGIWCKQFNVTFGYAGL